MLLTQLETKPDFKFSTLPVYVAQVYVDKTLDVYFIGVEDPLTCRPWAFTLGTPHCMVMFSCSKFPSD